jgi:uncharacterized membrane protein (DUF485 family)
MAEDRTGDAPAVGAPPGHVLPGPGPAVHADDHAPTIARNARYGLILFVIYLALYAGFMVLSAFAPERMGRPFLGGVNLAIVYGFGLIVAALVLALVYMALCRTRGDAQ